MTTTIVDQMNRERAFADARRHTFLVKVFRVVLPALCLLLVAGIALVNWLSQSVDISFNVDRIKIEDGALTMESAKMTGFNSKSEAYEIIADTAVQQLTNPEAVILNGIQGVLEAQGSEQSTLTARQGLYNTSTEQLHLEDDIVVRSADGFEIFLQTADMDLKNGTVISETPVEIQMIGGTIEAQGMEIENKGDKITFTRGVSMTIIPSQINRPENPAE